MGQKLDGGCAILFWGSWVSIEHKVAWAEAYFDTRKHLSPSRSSRFAATDIGQNWGGCAPLGGGNWVAI